MTREEFYKAIKLMKDQEGRYFIPVLGEEKIREFVLHIYLRNPGDAKYLPYSKLIYGHIQFTEEAILSNVYSNSPRHEFEAVISDMYDTALKEFNGLLDNITAAETDKQPATLEFLIACIKEAKKEIIGDIK